MAYDKKFREGWLQHSVSAPYSPDLNPTEKFWAWPKSRLEKVLSNFNSLDNALINRFQIV
jgi:hypothetical protein